MYISNCKIKLSGLLMSVEQKQAIEVIIMALQTKSPSDCSISLQVVNGESFVNAFLKVNSKMVSFESAQTGIDPLAVVRRLSETWQKKVNHWNANRQMAVVS